MAHADAMVKNADASGIAFDAFQKLSFGLEQAGLSGDSLQKGLLKLNAKMLEAGRGSKTAVEELGAIGLTLAELQSMKPEERFNAVVDGLNGITDEGQRSALALKLLGREFADRKFSSEGLAAASANLYVMSDASARIAEGFNDAINNIKTNMGNIMTDAIAPFIEYLTMALNAINKFSAENPVMMKVIVGLGLLGTAIAAVGVAFMVAGAIPLAIAAGIAAAIAGVIYVTNNWDSVVRSFTAFLAETFNVSIETAAGWVKDFGDNMKAAVTWVKEAATWLGTNLKSALNIVIDAIKTSIRITGDLLTAISDLFTLDFSGFATNMKNAFREVVDFFVRNFGTAVTTIVLNIKEQFGWALEKAAFVFTEAIRGGLNFVISKLQSAINSMIGIVNKINPFDPIGPADFGQIDPFTDDPGTRPSLKSSAVTDETGEDGYPLGEIVVNSNQPSAEEVATAENTKEIADALTDEKEGGKTGSGGGGPKADDTADSVSTAFMDTLKSSFTKALATGDWKEFSTSILDNITMNILEQFSNGLMDALFGDTFDNLFENFGESISKGLEGALSGVSTGGGGGLGLIGGLIGSIFGLAEGGLVPSDTPYSKIGRDSVPAMLTPGELVVPADEVGNYISGQSSGTYNINVTGDISRQTRREIMEMIPEIASGVNSTNHEQNYQYR